MGVTGDACGLYGADAPVEIQRRTLLEGRVPVSVVGLGKMGLPVAAVFADTFGNVVGADVDGEVVASVNAGDCHVKNEPGLPELVASTVADGSLRATDDVAAAASEAAVHVVLVPTPITDDDDPDLSILEAACRDVAAGLDPGDTVLVECTVPPRTCADRVEPLLAAESGLESCEFGLAFCPERTSSGRAVADVRGTHPKVVGGVDEESGRVAELLYGEVAGDVVRVPDATTAEAVKVFEGVYRDVNIALANELARYADDLAIDVREAIAVANTQPYCDIHDPGPGVGGHCIPYYPYFLLSAFDRDAPLLSTARGVNDAMPGYTVEKLEELLAARGVGLADAAVLVLGLTYRPGVEEIRATPALPVTEGLADRGATVYACDPVLDDAAVEQFPVERVALADLPALDVDAAVVVTPHEEFRAIDWSAFEDVVVVDGRDSVEEAAGHAVYTIGGGRR